MYYKLKQKQFVIDDGSYFTLIGATNKVFFSDNVNETPEDVKFNKTRKYQPIVLLWIVISEYAMLKPCLQYSGMAINQKIYQENV